MIMINHLNVLTPNHLYIFCLEMTTPYDGIEDVMSKYAPEGCTIDGIDEIEKRDRNKYCTDVQMARIDNDGQSKMAWLKRVATFQIILNFIEEAMHTVRQPIITSLMLHKQ
jgi:hypothetical protein